MPGILRFCCPCCSKSNFLPEVSQKSSFTLNREVYVSDALLSPSDLTKEMETIHPKMGNDHSEEAGGGEDWGLWSKAFSEQHSLWLCVHGSIL